MSTMNEPNIGSLHPSIMNEPNIGSLNLSTKNEPNGLLLVNKPLGITSFQVIRILRRATGIKKIGHGGTLDKNATGLLLLGIGQGTKKLTELLTTDKTYLFRIQFGLKSETGDSLGTSWSYKDVFADLVNEDSIKKVMLEKLTGEIWQTPPIYSALKKNGKRLSDYARNDEDVTIEPRRITIYSCTLLHFSVDSFQVAAEVKVRCSHGTYIRSICRDLGEALGTYAVMTNLCRTSLGSYHIGHASTLENLVSREAVLKNLLPLQANREGE